MGGGTGRKVRSCDCVGGHTELSAVRGNRGVRVLLLRREHHWRGRDTHAGGWWRRKAERRGTKRRWSWWRRAQAQGSRSPCHVGQSQHSQMSQSVETATKLRFTVLTPTSHGLETRPAPGLSASWPSRRDPPSRGRYPTSVAVMLAFERAELAPPPQHSASRLLRLILWGPPLRRPRAA